MLKSMIEKEKTQLRVKDRYEKIQVHRDNTEKKGYPERSRRLGARPYGLSSMKPEKAGRVAKDIPGWQLVG